MTQKTHESETAAAAAGRVLEYLERRRQARGIDREEIHAFDVSQDGGIFLRASDLEAMAAALTAQTTQQAPAFDEDEFTRILGLYVRAAIAQNEWDEIAPVGMSKSQAAKEMRLHTATEKAWVSLRAYVTSVSRPSEKALSQEELRKSVMRAIFDPGATEGYKGGRDLTTWQTDAVMRLLEFAEETHS